MGVFSPRNFLSYFFFVSFFLIPVEAAELVRKPDGDCTDIGTDYWVNTSLNFQDSNENYSQYACWDVYVPEGAIGVVTIKPQYIQNDFDALISGYNSSGYKIKNTAESDSKEIIVFGDSSDGNWYNVVISNYSKTGGKLRVTIHRVYLEEIFWNGLGKALGQYLLEEAVCGLFTGESCSNLGEGSADMVGRGVSVGLAALQDDSMASLTKAAAYNEVMRVIGRQVGLNRELTIVASNILSAYLDKIYLHY